MKYIAIFDLPDGYKMGCAAGKMIKPDGRKIYEEEEFENVYAQIEPLSEQKAEIAKKLKENRLSELIARYRRSNKS